MQNEYFTLNGERQALTAPLSLAALIEAQGWAGKRLALERNGEIVPRSLHAQTLLCNGDTIEVVVAVGGG